MAASKQQSFVANPFQISQQPKRLWMEGLFSPIHSSDANNDRQNDAGPGKEGNSAIVPRPDSD